jgi:hypothetical protein
MWTQWYRFGHFRLFSIVFENFYSKKFKILRKRSFLKLKYAQDDTNCSSLASIFTKLGLFITILQGFSEFLFKKFQNFEVLSMRVFETSKKTLFISRNQVSSSEFPVYFWKTCSTEIVMSSVRLSPIFWPLLHLESWCSVGI